MLTQYETIETTSAWEWKVPLGSLIFGLVTLVIHGLATEGAKGARRRCWASGSSCSSTRRSRSPRCSSPRPCST
jgi:hypothetical protein